MSRALIALGLVLIVIGALWTWLPRSLAWFGHLPGDVRIQTRHGVVFVPLASMLAISLALNLIAWLLRRLG